MHLAQVILASCALLAQTASAAAVAGTSPTFLVKGIIAQHTPHSSDAYVNFNVTSTALGLSTTTCDQFQTTEFANTIDNVPLTKCANPDVQFSLIRNTGVNNHFVLTVQLKSARGKFVGTKTLPAKDDIFFQSPAGSGFEWEELKTKQRFEIAAAKTD